MQTSGTCSQGFKATSLQSCTFKRDKPQSEALKPQQTKPPRELKEDNLRFKEENSRFRDVLFESRVVLFELFDLGFQSIETL